MLAGIYQHYKGGFYQCLGVARHSETGEDLVVYVSLSGIEMSGPRFRVRPLRLWYDLVKGIDGKTKTRFTYVGNEIKK